MADYIERDAMVAFLEDVHEDNDWLVSQYNADWICSWIESQPAADVVSRTAFEQVMWERDEALRQLEEHGLTLGCKADVVEVVRCKDCEYRMNSTGMVVHCALSGIQVDEDDFCSCGERRSE